MFAGSKPSTSTSKKHHCMTRKSPERDLMTSRIFLIDDEEIVTEMISHHLACFGFKDVHCFNDSVEAMETLNYVKADLLITDINMPGLGGGYLTRLAKKIDHLKDVPVIAISADTCQETTDKLMAEGMFRVLHKPVAHKELLLAVIDALDSRAQQTSFESKLNQMQRMQKANVTQEIRNAETALRDAFRK